MPLVSSSIPNLINGVSQQPAPTRLRTSCEDATNAYMSVVSGLQKRPNTEFVAALPSVPAGDASLHIVKKSASDKYVIAGTSGSLSVFDLLTGASRAVVDNSSSGYLTTSNPSVDLQFQTVADTTFVLNRSVTVTSSTPAEDGSRLNPYNRVSVYIKRAVASTTYAVYVNNALAATMGTSDNTTASTALEGTAEIAEALRADAASKGYTSNGTVGSVVYFAVPQGATVTVVDQYGGNAMAIIQDKVQEFSDLPPMDRVGRLVKVVGEANESGDDYWVVFDGQVWVETFGFDQGRALDPATMPHKLFDNGDGTFTFSEFDWDDRIAGDDATNPDPSFVGHGIQQMFLYKGRFGLLADENLIMSETDHYRNYWRNTVTQVLDTARIDVASTTGSVNKLRYANAFGDNLVLFSDKQQFKVTQGDTLTPATVGLQPTTSYDTSIHVAPVNSGPNVYFAVDGPRFTIFRELYIDSDNDQFDAAEITVQVPKYIPKNVTKMAVSTYEDILCVVSDDEPNAIYAYKWFLNGKEKVQSAWSKWVFDADIEIAAIDFVDQDLVIAYRMDGVLHIDTMRIEETVSIASDIPLLVDHKVTKAQTTLSYDALTGLSTITLPYATPHNVSFYRTAAPYGDKLVTTKLSNTQYTVEEDLTSVEYVAGYDYEFRFKFSQQYIRGEAGGGEVSVQDGRVQLRYMSLIYQNSSFFKVLVTPNNRQARTYTFSGRIFSDADNVLDTMPFDTGEFRFPITAQNTEVEIELVSDKPFACAFGSAEWDAMYYPRTRRI